MIMQAHEIDRNHPVLGTSLSAQSWRRGANTAHYEYSLLIFNKRGVK